LEKIVHVKIKYLNFNPEK